MIQVIKKDSWLWVALLVGLFPLVFVLGNPFQTYAFMDEPGFVLRVREFGAWGSLVNVSQVLFDRGRSHYFGVLIDHAWIAVFESPASIRLFRFFELILIVLAFWNWLAPWLKSFSKSERFLWNLLGAAVILQGFVLALFYMTIYELEGFFLVLLSLWGFYQQGSMRTIVAWVSLVLLLFTKETFVVPALLILTLQVVREFSLQERYRLKKLIEFGVGFFLVIGTALLFSQVRAKGEGGKFRPPWDVAKAFFVDFVLGEPRFLLSIGFAIFLIICALILVVRERRPGKDLSLSIDLALHGMFFFLFSFFYAWFIFGWIPGNWGAYYYLPVWINYRVGVFLFLTLILSVVLPSLPTKALWPEHLKSVSVLGRLGVLVLILVFMAKFYRENQKWVAIRGGILESYYQVSKILEKESGPIQFVGFSEEVAVRYAQAYQLQTTRVLPGVEFSPTLDGGLPCWSKRRCSLLIYDGILTEVDRAVLFAERKGIVVPAGTLNLVYSLD